MDREVVPRPCKICDWLLNSSWDHFSLHQGKEKKCESDHIVRGLQMTYFKAYIINWHGPTGFAVREAQITAFGRKREGPMIEKCYYSKKIIMIFLREEKMKTREAMRMTKLEIFLLFKTALFGYIYWKKSAHSFLGAWLFLLVHIRFTPSEGLNDFINRGFSKNRTMEKGHLPWSDFMVHGVKPALETHPP